MTAKRLDGKLVAARIREMIAREVAALQQSAGVTPGLGVILVGEDPASHSYVLAKERACAEAGMHSDDNRLPADTTEAELLRRIAAMNADPAIHGILVQLPLPRSIREDVVIRSIAPDKDVDGFHPVTLGKMMLGQPAYLPCTPHGIIQVLRHSGIETRGRHVVIVGRSHIVGAPLANLLMQKRDGGNATVTVCHTATENLALHTRMADILVVAAGRANTVTGDMIRPGAVVVDVGVNRVEDPAAKRGYRLVGDVDAESAASTAGWLTPVPGGVGPMTIAMLLYNTLSAACLAAGRPVPPAG